MVYSKEPNNIFTVSSVVRNSVSWATKRDAKSGFASHDVILAPWGPKYLCGIPITPYISSMFGKKIAFWAIEKVKFLAVSKKSILFFI
jgi:hypothetical protein